MQLHGKIQIISILALCTLLPKTIAMATPRTGGALESPAGVPMVTTTLMSAFRWLQERIILMERKLNYLYYLARSVGSSPFRGNAGLYKLYYPKPKDCADVLAGGARTSGVYEIYPFLNSTKVEVACDLETDGGGWLVFQRRKDGSIDFYRTWAAYKKGFGNPSGEFWLGNDMIHYLTKRGQIELRVDLVDHQGHTAFARYTDFRMGSEPNQYKLIVGGFDGGEAGDSMIQHNNSPFSTWDRDNDDVTSDSCARLMTGAWWYDACFYSNLNALYWKPLSIHNVPPWPINWFSWRKSYHIPLKGTEMKFRPRGTLPVR